MSPRNRRGFMMDVGRGMLAAGLGTSLAEDLGFSTAYAAEGGGTIPLGPYAALVELMRATPPEQLQPRLAQMLLDQKTDLKSLIAAGALANAVTFGGCDYTGYHTAMAMLPAIEMSKLSAPNRQALPVLKVLYRNAQQIQKVGGAATAVLHDSGAADHGDGGGGADTPNGDLGLRIRDACRKADPEGGEAILTRVADRPLEALNALQPAVQDDLNVHRFVFAHRTYGLVGLLGTDYSYSLLRQCVRFCADQERDNIEKQRAASPIRELLPKLLDQYKLAGKTPGTRDPGDKTIEGLSETIFAGPCDRAADAVAAALADGIDPEYIGEAISLASNLCVLRQDKSSWRTHGDSAGVHSSDATNAWRNMCRITEPRYAISGLVVAGYYAGLQRAPFQAENYPTAEHRALVKKTDAASLLAETEDAIRANDQGRAAAAIAIYGDGGHDVQSVFDLMLKYAVSEDGRLHAEKYYQTVREEYATTRPSLRWRQMVALARVTASMYGYNREDQHGFRAGGYLDACRLLGVEA